MQVCALTTGLNQPGSRFRWRQYVPFLEHAGVKSTELYTRWGAYPPRSHALRPLWLLANAVEIPKLVREANRYQLRFLQREMISTLCTGEIFLKSPFIFDVDDAIFLNQRFSGIDRIARRAALVICGNDFLESHFSKFANTVVLPTAVDTSRFHPGSGGSAGRHIGWSGSSSGFRYLYEIEPALRAVLQRFPDVSLKIVADRRPIFSIISDSRVEFQRWHPASEVGAIQNLSVGIMPLTDGPWERGKCSFKMLTYMAVGIPVVVSAVSMNNTVLRYGNAGIAVSSIDDWVDALTLILSDEARATQMGSIGRKIVETHYAASVIGPKLASVITQQMGG
jgi:glycosyltransferase involved in cell wall biosynthesis